MNNEQNSSSNIKYIFYFLLLVAIFIVGYFVGKVDINRSYTGLSEPNNYTLTGDIKQTVDNVDVNILWAVWSELENNHITSNLDGQSMMYGAVKGLVQSLDDPYTAFLTPQETDEYHKSNRGEFEGIGATLKQDGNYVVIESPIDGSPADKAGLKPGDAILEVDEKSMYGKSAVEVASLIRGKAGTQVKIKIFRTSANKEIPVEITRQVINIDNITVKEMGDGIVQIKIYKFTEDNVNVFNNLWDQNVDKVLAKNPKGLIIDLRNNPGGFVSSVEYVLGDFLPKGTLIFMEEDKEGNRKEHLVTRDGRLLNIPVVVIVNKGSASASEIFAGAIQDNKRGQIIGEETVGKGVEQKVISFSDGSSLQVVFQKWLTPNGHNINDKSPIKPDVVIEDASEQDKKALELLKG